MLTCSHMNTPDKDGLPPGSDNNPVPLEVIVPVCVVLVVAVVIVAVVIVAVVIVVWRIRKSHSSLSGCEKCI